MTDFEIIDARPSFGVRLRGKFSLLRVCLHRLVGGYKPRFYMLWM